MQETVTRVHGTCVALGRRAALLRGKPGAGKSDLALRFLSLAATHGAGQSVGLVADDQVVLEREDIDVIASAPPTLAGKLEVRGVGIVKVAYVARAKLVLVVDLVEAAEVPRMPSDPPLTLSLCGRPIALQKLCAFETSAHLKLALALGASF